MKVFIHIGHSRTGTTTLQALLTANRELLRNNGIDYPPVGILLPPKGIAQHKLAFSLLPEWPKFAINAKASRDTCWAELTEHLNSESNNNLDKLLLSSEAFSSLDESAIQFVCNYFKGHSVTAIFTRRDPEEWRRSWREHRITRGHHVPEPTVPAPDINTPIIEKWSARFDLRVVDYGPSCTREILGHVGINANELHPVAKRNVQPSRQAIDLINQLNLIDLNKQNRLTFNKKIVNFFNDL